MRMASDESSLRALENIMTEFFHNSTTNERKREIEELLNNFAQQTGAWRHCFYFLSNTRNEYVMMYSLTVFENLINKLWLGIPSQEKIEIRSSLPKLLLAQHKGMPTFIRNKLAKVIVDIGRQDWPMFYHDFFSNILQLIQQPEMVSLGLMMLKTTSEELACPREDLSVARKEELRRMLLDQVPTVLNLLSGILEIIWDKNTADDAAPPPSPFTVSMGELLGSLFSMADGARFFSQPIPRLDRESEHVCSLALECLAHLFSWIPLSASITPHLLATIFHFARFGCDAIVPTVTGGDAPNGGSHRQGNRDQPEPKASLSLGVLAMSCINELMSKNCVPAEFEEYLFRMFQHTFYLLQKITKDNKACGVRARLDALDESYLEKFTDFLRLFVSVHLRRIESNYRFPVVEFLSLLFRYTFNQPTHEGYFACLDIWSVFLDYLSGKIRSRMADKKGVLERYKDALVALNAEVLRRMQFRYNQAQLEELDDETLDDDNKTEWQHFLHQSLEVVAKVAELLPAHAFSTLSPILQEDLEIYLGLQQFIVHSGAGGRLNITAENDCRRLHCSLRDLSSLLQAVGRLAEHFIGDVFNERVSDALSIVERLVEMTLYGTQTKLFAIETAAPSVLKPDLIDVHAQSLAALQAYSHWLAQFGTELRRQGQDQKQFVSLVSTAMMAVAPLLDNKVPEKILLSSAHLLVSIASTVRPPFLATLPTVQKMFTKVSDGSVYHLNAEAQVLVCRALVSALLLPWPSLGDGEQQWVVRSSNFCGLIQTLTQQYRALKNSLQQDKLLLEPAKPVVRRTLAILRDVVESISEEVTKSRQICHQAIQESVQVTLVLFPLFISQPDVTDDILTFFLSLFQGLKVQIGVPFTEQTIQTFLNMFTRDQLADSILHDGSAGCRVVEKFLKILQLVAQEPGAAFKAFLPSIISLCMEQLYPIVAARSSPDIKAELFELLFELLHHNWRHFFKTAVLATIQRGGHEESMENQGQFVAIMQAFGQSFLQPDIHIFKQNLAALESLNAKHKLYHKTIFRTSMLFQFLHVLLQVLLHRSHDLLQDEIAVALYNMASVDFDGFYASFLPHFLETCDGVDMAQKGTLAGNFKMDRDLPSFTQCVHRFVNDLRYYRLCNSSLPAGTVKF